MLLIIEVSSSTRRKDDARAKLYARLAIPEYWLIDLDSGLVVVHQAPTLGDPAKYTSVVPLGRNANVGCAAVDGLTLATDFLLQLAAQP